MFRKATILFPFLLTFLFSQAQQLLNDKVSTGNGTTNAVIYLPANYSASKSYPLVIYAHNVAEAGTDINLLYNDGLPLVLKNGYKPSVDFIMIAPQRSSYTVDPSWLQSIINDAKSRYSIDGTRIYVTAVGAGGWAAYGSQLNISTSLATQFAGVVVLSAATQDNNNANLDWWKTTNTPLWAVVGQSDTYYSDANSYMVSEINKRSANAASILIRPGIGHGNWNDIYNGTVKNGNLDVWQWLTQYQRINGAIVTGSSTTTTPTPPTTTTGATIHVDAASYVAGNNIMTQTTTDVGGGLNVGGINTGSWMDYNVTVPTAGTYTLRVRVATPNSGTQLQFQKSDGTFIGLVNMPSTNGWQTWQTDSISVTLTAGTQKLRVYSQTGAWNFHWFELAPTSQSSTPTPTPTPPATTSASTIHVEAEAFSNSYHIMTQGTSDAGGGLNVGGINSGSWMDYTLNVPSAGNYMFKARVASPNTGNQIQLLKGDGTVLNTINMPSTNGWQTWQTDSIAITLPAGAQTFRVLSLNGAWNFNWFELTSTTQSVTTTTPTPGSGTPPTTGAHSNFILKANTGTDIYMPNGLTVSVQPGDTLNIMAGTYNIIDLGNFHGTASNPIIIRNYGGVVSAYIFRISNQASFFKVLGNGTPGVTYGFVVNGGGTSNEGFGAYASDFEVGYIDVSNTEVGIMIKKNPVAGDPTTQYPNYYMRNIYIHHNYVHNTTGEGMYIGHAYPNGDPYNGNLIPIRLANVEIAYNTTAHTGWDGIQLSNATDGCKIHDNTVSYFGDANWSGQQAGIIMGANTTGDINNNTITTGTGNGMQVFGYGTINITNNSLISTGNDGTIIGQESIFVKDDLNGVETRPMQLMNVTNNTIKYPMPKCAIRVSGYNSYSLPGTVTNNKILLPNAPFNWLTLYIFAITGSTVSGNTLITQ
jgi:hypothetical protein